MRDESKFSAHLFYFPERAITKFRRLLVGKDSNSIFHFNSKEKWTTLSAILPVAR
jgi:hypothetical protein